MVRRRPRPAWSAIPIFVALIVLGIVALALLAVAGLSLADAVRASGGQPSRLGDGHGEIEDQG